MRSHNHNQAKTLMRCYTSQCSRNPKRERRPRVLTNCFLASSLLVMNLRVRTVHALSAMMLLLLAGAQRRERGEREREAATAAAEMAVRGVTLCKENQNRVVWLHLTLPGASFAFHFSPNRSPPSPAPFPLFPYFRSKTTTKDCECFPLL